MATQTHRFNPSDFELSSQPNPSQQPPAIQSIQSSHHSNRQRQSMPLSQHIQHSSPRSNRQHQSMSLSQPIESHSSHRPIQQPRPHRPIQQPPRRHIQQHASHRPIQQPPPRRHIQQPASHGPSNNGYVWQYRQNKYFYLSYQQLGRQLRSHPRADSTMQRWAGYCDNICDKVLELDKKRIVLIKNNLWHNLQNVVGYNTWHNTHIGETYYIYNVNPNGLKNMWINNSITLLMDVVVPKATGRFDNNDRRQLDAQAIANRLSINRGRGSMRGRRRDVGRNRNNTIRTNKISLNKLLSYGREEFETPKSGKYLIMMGAIMYEFDRLTDKEGYALADFSYDSGINTIGKFRFIDWTKKLSLKDGWKAQVKGTGRGLRTFEYEALKNHVIGLLNATDKKWAYRYIMGTYASFDAEGTPPQVNDIENNIENDIDDDNDDDDNDDDDNDDDDNDDDVQVPSSYNAVRGGHSLGNVRFDPMR